MSLSVGDKLGSYEILAKIGAGGMGKVYRPRDPRLGRDIAIKFSVKRFSERFDREARDCASAHYFGAAGTRAWAFSPSRITVWPSCRFRLLPQACLDSSRAA